MEEIGKILPNVFKSQLSCLEPPVLEVLAPLWPRVVGKTLAKQCRPVSFVAGTLTLATDDATWAEALRPMVEEIRGNVNQFLGKCLVRRVKILRPGKLHPGDPSRWRPENLHPSPSNRRHWPGKAASEGESQPRKAA